MNKRTLILGSGALAAAMVPLAMKAEAAETPDWRDELLSLHTSYSVYSSVNITYPEDRKNMNGVIETYGIGLYWWEDHKWVVVHDHRIRDSEITDYFKSLIVNEKLEGNEAKFDTLEEAYLYAKELKEKHYV